MSSMIPLMTCLQTIKAVTSDSLNTEIVEKLKFGMSKNGLTICIFCKRKWI